MSNIKEPYSISVWEEELIPVQDWYVKGEERLTREEYERLSETEREGYELHTVMEHYEETQGIIIGAHDMDSVYAAVNPILKKNVNGSVDLTFGLYYKVYDPDLLDYNINPFTQSLVNEAKVKLHFRGKWYDLVVKNCVEDSTNFMYNYTCKDIYVNELNKNGFKVELDVELENNQGTAVQLAETILLDTDWTVDKDHSDILVETKIEPLFVGILNKDVPIKLVNRYAPKDLFDTSDQPETATLSKGNSVLFFYSDVADNKKNPQVLCRFEQKEEDGTMEYKDPIDSPEFYEKDANEDIIINACNYTIEETVLYASAETITSIPNIIENQLSVYDFARGEKVIKSQLSGYDPDLDKFIFKFYKKGANGVADTDKEYYGYCKIDILSSDLAKNYLANSDNFISLDSGWVFEGISARTTKVKGVEKTAGYSGQLYTMDTELLHENKPEQESVLVLQLKNEGGAEHYPDTKGEFYCNKFETRDGKQVPVEFVEVASAKGDVVEDNIRAAFYENRKNGIDGYLDKTDDEIEDMINEYLLSLRYSVRSRYAINTGIAANRSAIESLTPNEEYMFAVSLGKYIENEDGTTEKEPHYCTLKEVNGETVEEYTEIYYGAKTPTEFYKFSNIYEDDKFAAEAGADALKATDKAMEQNPYKYYLMNPDYKKEYDNTYNEFIDARTAEYKEKYLNSINNSSKEGIDNWRAGGSNFKEEFKKHLTDKTSFTYNPPNNTSDNTQWYFCTSLAARLIDYCTNKPEDISVARALYEAFIDRPEGWSEENPRYANEYGYFYGLYPAMAFAVLLIADANGKKWKWEPMGYDDAQYPEFDDLTQDLVIFARSLNEAFFGTLYYALRDTFTINTGTILEWNTELLSYEGLTEKEQTEKFVEVQQKIVGIVGAAYEELLKSNSTDYEALNYSQQYELPGTFDKQGGSIYQRYLQNWQTGDNYIDTGETKKDENGKEWPVYENTNATKEAQKAIIALENKNQLFTKPESIDYEAFGNFLLEKENALKVRFPVSEVGSAEYNAQYNAELIEWIREYLQGTTHSYYYLTFAQFFMKNWRDKHIVGTFVYNDRVFDLETEFSTEVGGVKENEDDYTYYKVDENGDFVKDDKDNKIPTQTEAREEIWTQDTDLNWRKEKFTTFSADAKYVAIKTRYNPYTSESPEDAGGYVFDRNTKQVRLFNLEKDLLNATYKPVKDDEGDFIFDPFQGVYRPFRNWRDDVKKDPVTFKSDDELGVYGDITHHPMKWFDGHIGSWEETPTRFRMVRLREDPNEGYVYLDKETHVIETGHYDGKDVQYPITYPAGYQTDLYIPDDDGKYIKTKEIKKAFWEKSKTREAQVIEYDDYRDTIGNVKVSVENDGFKVNGQSYPILSRIDDKIRSFIDQVKVFFSGIDASIRYGLKTSNIGKGDSDYYDEDRTSITVYAVKQGDDYVSIAAPAIDDIENPAEVSQNRDKLIEINANEPAAIAEEGTAEKPIVAETYTKFKWYNWRHWGRQRYSFKPKICVYRNVNGVVTYKPYNNVQDCISADYRIMTHDDAIAYNKEAEEFNKKYETEIAEGTVIGKIGVTPSFYLSEPIATYRQAKEEDYGSTKYVMQLQDKKNKAYWVESPNGEDYLRHYKTGDGEIRLWDGHFGKWIDCFKEIEVVSEAEFREGDWWLGDKDKTHYDDALGLMALKIGEKENEDPIFEYYLPDFYLPYNDIMIVYDERVFGRKERFTRMRVSSKEGAYVYQDGIYMPLSEYRDKYGFFGKLDYRDLRVSLIDDYDYKAENFAITNIPTETDKQKYLTFDLSQKPSGEMSLVVTEDTTSPKVIKEKWVYWIAKVNKGLSLTKDPFQKFGMFFEKVVKRDGNNNIINPEMTKYPFLGMQLFKHIPYERTLKEKEIKPLIVPNGTMEYKLETLLSDIEYSSLDEWKTKYASVLNKTKEQEVLDTFSAEYAELIKQIYTKLFAYDPFLESVEDDTAQEVSLKLLDANNEHKKLLLENFLKRYNISMFIKSRGEGENTVYSIELRELESTEIIPLFPGQPPDATELKRSNYYIYDPETITDLTDVVYDYVGTNPYEDYEIAYDPLCQKIRSIKGKESNYFKLLQDTCDSFDCWLEPVIEHDENGRVEYVEKRVYIDEETDGEESQIYVGEDHKEAKVDDKIERLIKKFGRRISNEANANEYVWVDDEECEIEQEYEIKELNRLIALRNRLDSNPIKHYMIIPDKKIRFKRYVGAENWNGFKYGVNLKHIKRTIDSNQISTRVIVKPNKNEHATDGFCTIQRAPENTLKENFLIDFSYYVQQRLLNNSELINDLYTSVNTKLNYYGRLGYLNRKNDDIALRLSSLQISLDKVKADYDTAMLAYEAALEEIRKTTYTITSNYDSYGEALATPWQFNQSQEYETRIQTSAPASTFQKTIDNPIDGDGQMTITLNIPETATQVDYPKYNDGLRTLLDQMDVYQKEAINNEELIAKLKPEKEDLERQIQDLLALSKIIVEKKNELNRLFYHKYARFIQEGSWVDENYIDDNLYYLDALAVLRTSSKPKITYDIGVVDIAAAYEYEEDRAVLESELGDRTYVEDTEFFGYKDDGITPYWEMVVVSEKIYNLNDPSQNQTKVKNYSTQFDDLFQRIAATSQTLQFNEGSYGRAASLINDDGTIKEELLKESIESSDSILLHSNNEKVTWGRDGITVVSESDRANVIKIVSRGILISNDGGSTYKTALTGDGFSADILSVGKLNVDNVLIGANNSPNFFWDKVGISAYKTKEDKVDHSTFVRMDQFGFYGIKGEGVQEFNYKDTFAPKRLSEITNNPNAMFGLTWDGFFLNTGDGTGRVTIGTSQDFKMSEYSEESRDWVDRVIIGKMENDDGEEYYGFRLQNALGQVVMDTNDSGELYLKQKLRISNFSDGVDQTVYTYVKDAEDGIVTNEGEILNEYYYKYEENNGIKYKIYYNTAFEKVAEEEISNAEWDNSFIYPKDRVTLGIVDVYKRGDNYVKVEAPQKTYSSVDYLTKVFSVKANGNVGLEQFTEDNIKQLIEKNETFAIFDNGNLYAKNAWIEGHIQATSGYFRNVDIFGELKVGKEDNTENIGRIFQADGNWSINGDGTAFFNNVIVSGTISSAIFEYDKIQTIAGSMLIRPGVYFSEYKSVETEDGMEYTKVIIDSPSLPKEFENGYIKIGNSFPINTTVFYEIIPKPDPELNELETINSISNQSCVLYLKTTLTQNTGSPEKFSTQLKNQTKILLYMGADNQTVTGLSINASQANSILPTESFSIVQLNKNSQEKAIPKAIFGRIPINILSEFGYVEQDNAQTPYGLYCDDVFLTGSLISQNENIKAGISTKGIYKTNYGQQNTNNLSGLLLWAGAPESITTTTTNGMSSYKFPFMVTEEGYLYAEKGVFSGTVESAEIKTATITGKGDTYGLTIYSGVQGSNGLFFGEQNNNIPYVTMSAGETTIYNTFSIKDNNTILFKLLSYKEKETDIYEKDAIGMFSIRQNVEAIEEYYLNIRKMNDDKIGFYWKEKLQFSLSEDGFDLGNSTSNTLKVGNNLKILPVPKSCGSGADFYAE